VKENQFLQNIAASFFCKKINLRKPDVGQKYPVVTPQESDEFNTSAIGLQWQWQANPQLAFVYPSGNLGYFRLNCFSKPENYINLWAVPNMLLQKFPAEEFMATTKLTFNPRIDGDETGFVVMGENYQYISPKKKGDGLAAQVVTCENARLGGAEKTVFQNSVNSNTIYFRIKVKAGAVCSFRTDGKEFIETASDFKALPGRWIGSKIVFFALREKSTNDSGSVDIDWIRIEKN